jgi:hypothetical protein
MEKLPPFAEFQTVDLIVNSSADTRGVDAFVLALVKCERQMRRLLTFLVFQYPCFAETDVPALRSALSENRRVYFDGMIFGVEAIYPKTIANLIGNDYERLRRRVDLAIEHRNKIFHGQLTSSYLSRDDLLSFAADIRTWCELLASATYRELGYDGFMRNSFRKCSDKSLWIDFRSQMNGVDCYVRLIETTMSRA